MFEHKLPLFNPAPLRKEILENMRDLTLMEQNARYSEYSDGILIGCGLVERSMNIGVKSGLVKYAGRIYVSTGQDSLTYSPTDDWTVLKIRFGNEEKTRDFSYYSGELILDENTVQMPNEMELGRFKLKKGSSLRTKYTDFQDMETEYDTVNLINVPYAGIGESTLCPEILVNFAREAYPHVTEPLDTAFCTACLAGSGIMSRESIHQYIWRRLGNDTQEYGNKEMHRHLSYLLTEIKGLARHNGPNRPEGVLLL